MPAVSLRPSLRRYRLRGLKRRVQPSRRALPPVKLRCTVTNRGNTADNASSGEAEALTAQQAAADLASTAADDLIIQAAAKAPYSPRSALTDLNAADKLRPGDYATLQMRGLIRADLNDKECALGPSRHLVLIGTAEEPARLTQQLRQPRELVASLRGRQTRCSQDHGDFSAASTPGSCKTRLQAETDLSLARGLQLLQQAEFGAAQAVFKRGLATFDVLAFSLAMANDGESVMMTSRVKLEQMLDVCEVDLRGERGTANEARVYLGPKPEYLTPENSEPNPSYVADDLIIRAAMYFKKENFASALQALNQADQLQSDDYATLQLRGQVKALLKDYSGAVQDLTGRALDEYLELTYRIGSYISIGDIDQACEDIALLEGKHPELAKQLLATLQRGDDWGHLWGPAPDAANGRADAANTWYTPDHVQPDSMGIRLLVEVAQANKAASKLMAEQDFVAAKQTASTSQHVAHMQSQLGAWFNSRHSLSSWQDF
ncbi:hypothetical protein WJX82_001818 [Trebouxia sp. C0006]